MRFPLALILAALSLHAETGDFTIHMLLHAIGEERYEIAPAPDGGLTLTTTFHYADRGFFDRTTIATLRAKSDYTPLHLEIKPNGNQPPTTLDPPAGSFAITGPSPFAIQMAMMRYWTAHGKPSALPAVGAKPGADAIRIQAAGKDTITIDGRKIALDRYTIANLMFGREILWMDAQGNLAAAMTFAGGLPMEAVRTEYEPALHDLHRAGIAQEMADLQ